MLYGNLACCVCRSRSGTLQLSSMGCSQVTCPLQWHSLIATHSAIHWRPAALSREPAARHSEAQPTFRLPATCHGVERGTRRRRRRSRWHASRRQHPAGNQSIQERHSCLAVIISHAAEACVTMLCAEHSARHHRPQVAAIAPTKAAFSIMFRHQLRVDQCCMSPIQVTSPVKSASLCFRQEGVAPL